MLNLNRNGGLKMCSKGLALFLAIFFLSISIIQALHKHNPRTFDRDSDGQEYIYNAEKCSICDYTTHQQVQAHFYTVPVLAAVVTKPVTLLDKCFAGIYKFTLQGYTNKGPPVTFC